MSLYAKGHVVLVSRTATRFEWMILDCIESLIQLPARFVKWNGNLVHPEAWLKPEGWKALVLVLENSGNRPPGQSQGSGSYESTVGQIASQCATESRPIFLIRPRKDAGMYDAVAAKLPADRTFDLERVANPQDDGEFRRFISQLSQALGRQALPNDLIGQVLDASRADFEDAREIVANLKKAAAKRRARVPHLRASPQVATSAPHRHRVPLLASLSREAGSVHTELLAMSAALSEYGFSFQHFLSRSAHDWSWISQRDFAVVSVSEEVGTSRQGMEIRSRFERIRVDQSKLRTRRYFLDSSRELDPALTGVIFPIVSWSSSSAGEGEGVLRIPPRQNSAVSRWTPTLGTLPPSGVIDPPFLPSHLMVRDLRAYYRKSAVWRRVFGFAARPPQRLLNAVRHLVITALEKEYKAVIESPLVVYKTTVEGSGKLSLVYIRAPSGELHPILVGCIGSAGRLPAALYTYRLLLQWRPRFVLMCGIAGSLAAKPEDEPKVGDLVIATETIDYEYGKIKEAFHENSGKLDDVVPQIRAKVVPCALNSELQQFVDSEGWQAQPELQKEAREIVSKELWKEFVSSGKYEDTDSLERARASKLATFSLGRIHYGASCTGDKVVALRRFKFQLINALSSLNNSIRSVEMEGAAVQRAIERMTIESKRRIDFAMVRGISDDADEHKSDRWQELAAKLASDYTLRFIGWHLGTQ